MTPANPLLAPGPRIPFHRIGAEHVEEAVSTVLAGADAQLEELAAAPGPGTWTDTMEVLEEITRRVEEVVSPVRHLLAVAETPALREAYNRVLPAISSFWSRLPLNEGVWRRIEAFSKTEEARSLTGIRARHLAKVIREFLRSGADLPPVEKKRLEEIRVEISRLQQRFGENVLDATNAYELAITDDAMLAGLPEATLGVARSRAAERDLEGWILSLDFPTYESVQKYAHDRDLREELHRAYVGRCRDGEHDNRDLIMGILGLRQELAEMLGYADYSDYRLEEAMANSGSRAFDFIEDLRSRTRPYWQRDVEELRSHGRKLGLDPIRPWDVSYVAEGLRRERFDIDDEMLRPYFPLDQVQKGLFRIARGVFGVSVVEAPNEEVWNPDVGFYELRDDDGTLLGSFYTDWFPRKAKRQGAWMTALITGGPRADGFAPHLGCISGNFSPRNGDRPALLTHREVETLFHEFGHLLHHCTSDVPIPSRTGLRTPWDWVELPSQIMENWIWEREAQRLFARHYATGRPLPPDVLDRMIRARRFMGGYGQMRQLGFAYLDLKLHREYARAPDGDVLAYVERHTLPFVPDEGFVGSHVVTTFSHLFSGGYASAYYSYLWSEVLEADAFSRFRKEGIFNRETGMAFRRAILSRGDAEDPDVLFRDFMGRDPDPEALIRRNLGDRPE